MAEALAPCAVAEVPPWALDAAVTLAVAAVEVAVDEAVVVPTTELLPTTVKPPPPALETAVLVDVAADVVVEEPDEDEEEPLWGVRTQVETSWTWSCPFTVTGVRTTVQVWVKTFPEVSVVVDTVVRVVGAMFRAWRTGELPID